MSVREKRLSNCAPLPATASKQLRLAMHCVSRVRADHENVITRLSCCTACRGMEICHCGKSPLSGNRLSRVRFVDGSHEHGVECHIRPRVPSENSRSGGSRPCRVIAEVREIAVAITLASAGLYGTIPKPDRIFLLPPGNRPGANIAIRESAFGTCTGQPTRNNKAVQTLHAS